MIRERARRVLDEFGEGAGHVFNLGHGITPDVPPEHVADSGRELRRATPFCVNPRT